MDIQFFGAAKMVTGSNYLIKTKDYKLLVDCGMFQGGNEIERLNYEKFPYDPSEIDFMILTHAHIDHSGRIPKLVKEGFNGNIICTKATYDLCKIMLMDSAKIQVQDAQWDNKKRLRSGKPLIEPLYDMEDAERSLKYFTPYFYNQTVKINEDITIRFKDAGHILGSSILEIWINENGENTKIVFSGDLGMPGRPIINDPEYIEDADILVIESTYGDTVHETYQKSTNQLIEIINKTALRGGTVLIPSFAVGRTQELIYELNNYYEYNKDVEEYLKIPIYIDSPMAVEATKVFQENSSSFNKKTRDLILGGDNPFTFDNLRYIKSQEESMALNKSNYPKVIISSSGMATAGRIRHHLKHNLWNPLNSLVFVGYQAEGSLGRILLDGAKKVKLLGEEINVALEVYDLEGFSGHADQVVLMDWVSKFKTKPKKIFIVHGEVEASETLGKLLEQRFKIETIIPNIDDSYNISNNLIELSRGFNIEPALLKADIENEMDKIYNQFNSLISRSSSLYEEKLLEKNYDLLKNRLIELQSNLMDLNIMLGK